MTTPALNRPVDVLDVLDVRRHLGVKQSTKNANAAFLDWRDWCNYLPEADAARSAVRGIVDALALYTAVCGNTCAMVPRDVAAEMYDKARAALAAIGSQP